MKKRKPFFLTLLTWIAFLAGTQAETDLEKERAAIVEVIQYYFEGDRNGDVDLLKKAFHPQARLFTVREDGSLGEMTQPQFQARKLQQAREGRPKPESVLLDLDITGKAASAKIRMTYSHGSFTDYLSLLKLDGSWVIVNKIYDWEASR